MVLIIGAECDEKDCRHDISNEEEIYCESCYQTLLDRIEELEGMVESLEDDLRDKESEIEDLENEKGELEDQIMELENKEEPEVSHEEKEVTGLKPVRVNENLEE